MPHPDLAAEQAYVDDAYRCLAAMRARTTRSADLADSAAGAVDSAIAQAHLQHRLASLDDDVPGLSFGRLDGDDDETWYIGRRHVEDARGDPVVVDWRADVATPSYRATAVDPQGLRRRRRFVMTDRRIDDLFDEVFDDPDSVDAAHHGGIPDPLLAELERDRTGEMRDIVATIAAEQDVVIRAPLDTCLVVQGGPGTGKTAVGLHRAAFLLYEHRRRLDVEGVLVIGPNPIFLRYIAQVLPSLGETAARQTTLDRLLAGTSYRPVGADDDEAAALQGDARMASVVAAAVARSVRRPEGRRGGHDAVGDGSHQPGRRGRGDGRGARTVGPAQRRSRRLPHADGAPGASRPASPAQPRGGHHRGGRRRAAGRSRLGTHARPAVAPARRARAGAAGAHQPGRARGGRGRRPGSRRASGHPPAGHATDRGRALDGRRPRPPRRGRGAGVGAAARLRPRRGRRGTGPVGHGSAGAGPSLARRVDDRARRPGAGHRARCAGVVGGRDRAPGCEGHRPAGRSRPRLPRAGVDHGHGQRPAGRGGAGRHAHTLGPTRRAGPDVRGGRHGRTRCARRGRGGAGRGGAGGRVRIDRRDRSSPVAGPGRVGPGGRSGWGQPGHAPRPVRGQGPRVRRRRRGRARCHRRRDPSRAAVALRGADPRRAGTGRGARRPAAARTPPDEAAARAERAA